MTADVVTAVKDLLRERGKLDLRIHTLRKREDALRGLVRELEELQGRISEIDSLLAPLRGQAKPAGGASERQLAAISAANAARAAKAHGQPSQRDRIVEEIGRRGLSDWSVVDIALAAGSPLGSTSAVLTVLYQAGKLHRVSPGVYRVQRGEIT